MTHDIPAWQIPDGAVLTDNDEERELNEKLDTPKWVYTEEPDDEICPYCGNPYEGVSWASRVTDGSTGVPMYDTSISDFITQFIHQYHRHREANIRSVGAFCSPEYEDELITLPATPDYKLSQLKKK